MSVSVENPVIILDPSLVYRPEFKSEEKYRVFNKEENETQKMVYNTYKEMHTKQTVDFVKGRLDVWTKFNRVELPAMEALELLNTLVDESDTDIDLPNSYHGFQTAEGIRKVHPENEWFQLTGLIHDMGKIMALYGEPQWCVVGDTFPVGCAPGDHVVYKETFDENPDMKNPKYNTKYGMYSPNCGLENLMMSWGHDEYLYRVLKNHKSCTLPEEALYMIRYHSFYPWHQSGDYTHLCSEKDAKMHKWIKELNKFDLYSKCPDVPDVQQLKDYYQKLIDKYIPGKIKF